MVSGLMSGCSSRKHSILLSMAVNQFEMERERPAKKFVSESHWVRRGFTIAGCFHYSSASVSTFPSLDLACMQLLLERSHYTKDELCVYLGIFYDFLSSYENVATFRSHCLSAIRHIEPKLKEGATEQWKSVEVCLNAMQRHVASAAVQLECCRLLQSLLSRAAFIPNACLSTCMYSMLVHLQDEAVQVAILELLRLLRVLMPSPLDWFPMLPTLMQVLSTHDDNIYIQQLGLSMIADLCGNDLCRSKMPNGVSFLLRIMRKYPQDCLINCNAAAGICWLVHTGPGSGRLQVQQQIQVVLECLEKHISNVSVFGNIVCVLCGLLVPLEDEKSVMKIIGKGMLLHQSSSKVQESCLRWIRFRQLQNCHDEVLALLPQMLQCMKLHRHDRHLQNQACELLVVLFEASSEMKMTLTDNGVADVILSVQATHHQDEAIRQCASLLLSLLLPPAAEANPFGGDLAAVESICHALQANPPII